MRERPFFKDAIIYQVYPRSFQDSNEDGIGDIQGIISRLDYLAELGINVIWLSPVYDSPNDDNGYDISNYTDIHPEFGTMKDMEELINKARVRNIRIIMDLVINHTSDEHPWFVESKKKNSPYRDYYIWRDKPNNWTSFFGGKAWSKEGDEYYLHLFSPKQPDLNWHNPKVMEEIQEIMHFWLKKGIAGFRCDVINIIYKTSLMDGKKRFVLTGREHYHSQEGCHEILRTLRKEVLDHYDVFTVGETVMVTTKEANDLILPDRKELDMVFAFEHMETDQVNNKWFKTRFNPNKWMKVVSKWQQEAYWNANYLENHDQPRSVSRFGNDGVFHKESAKMLATLYMTLKGTPYIYQGQEIGMTNGDFEKLGEYRDVETHRIEKLAKKLGFPKCLRMRMIKKTSRDNARQPMQWSDEGGFTTTVPWIRGNKNTTLINVEKQYLDFDSIWSHYQKLIRLRKQYLVFIEGEFEPLYQKNSIYIFSRSLNTSKWVTISNMSKHKKKLPMVIQGEIVLSNYNRASMYDLKLKPYESILLKVR